MSQRTRQIEVLSASMLTDGITGTPTVIVTVFDSTGCWPAQERDEVITTLTHIVYH
jgi:hypothetical protein